LASTIFTKPAATGFGYSGASAGFIFFWKYRDANLRSIDARLDLLVFRFSRLYPLHFVTLIIVAILQTA